MKYGYFYITEYENICHYEPINNHFDPCRFENIYIWTIVGYVDALLSVIIRVSVISNGSGVILWFKWKCMV